mgnify:CR=1 FL=1
MIETWKNNLINLPDDIFFEIVRNYLGDLKTPFNKHDLVRSLYRMLSRKEIRERILDLIDPEDNRLLTAAALLKTTTIEELFSFTRQFYTFLELHNRIENLQHRLLICIDYPEKTISLSPLFEEELCEKILDSSLMFPVISSGDGPAPHPWLSEQLLSAFISFLSNNGSSKKKIETRFIETFSSVTDSENAKSLSELLGAVLKNLKFTSTSGQSLSLNLKNIEQFGSLEPNQRILLIAAAAAVFFAHPEKEPGKKQAEYTDICYYLLFALFSSLEKGTGLSETDLHRMLGLITRNLQIEHPDIYIISHSPILEMLCYTGFLSKADNNYFSNFSLNSSEKHQAKGQHGKLRVQSNMEITAPPDFPLSEEITAALCSEISVYDITRTYTITKPAFASARGHGLSFDKIIEGLENSSSGKIPQNILFSFQAWEKEYSSISLNYGVVMTVAPERLPLIEHSPVLQEFLLVSPAPGVFLLDPTKENLWRRAFSDAGFDILPQINIPEGSSPSEKSGSQAFYNWTLTEKRTICNYSGSDTGRAAEIIKRLTGDIEKLGMTKENKAKLTARTQKKLVLEKAQLAVSNRPEEKGEAGGLDHRAKIRLAERAVELDNLLEITIAKDFEMEKQLIKPLRIVKKDDTPPGKPAVMVIEGIELPDEKEIRTAIYKISHMRMLKSSLFTP